MSNHPREIRHHQETPRNSSNHALGHQCSFSGPIGLWLKYPYFNHRSPTYVRNTQEQLGINRKIQKKPRDSSNHSLGHQCSLSGSIGLWLNYHKLPICLPLKQGKKKRGTFWPVPTKIKPTTVQAREKPPYGLIDTCTSWRHSMER